MIDEIVVDNDYQFTFKFGKELRLGDLDTIFRTAIVTQAAYEADPNGMSTNPVGTGPYTLTSYTAGSSFTYTAREDFWQTDENYLCARDRANVKTINYVILAESSQRTMALEQKSIDMCSEISNEDIGEFREGGAYSGDYWTYGVPDNLSLLIFCNCDSSRLTSNKDLRTAIFYAINAEPFCSLFTTATAPIPKACPPLGVPVMPHPLTPRTTTTITVWIRPRNIWKRPVTTAKN